MFGIDDDLLQEGGWPSVRCRTMIRIGSKFSLVELEEASKTIDQLTKEADLSLPKKIFGGGSYGISIAISQVVAKWASSQYAGSLVFLQSEFEEVVKYPHGLISTFMAMKHRDKNGYHARKDVLQNAREIVEAMSSYQFRRTQKGRGKFLACFSGMKNEFIRPFYNSSIYGDLRNLSDFQKLTRNMLDATHTNFSQKMKEKDINQITSVILELIENADNHGSKNLEGETYNYKRPNVRGLTFMKKVIFPSESTDTIESDPITYAWRKEALERNRRKTLNVLELIVFDFGPGILRTRLFYENKLNNLKDTSFKEEEEIICKAFQIGNTTKQESGTGYGLPTVVECLSDLDACMRLRTGRICYLQNFFKDKNGFEPTHLIKEKPELSDIPGTVYTILIPLMGEKD